MSLHKTINNDDDDRKNILRQANAGGIVCIIQDEQTAGIICKVNTSCMDNHFLLQKSRRTSFGVFLCLSLSVCLSLSLSVAVRLSLCISDKKLLNKGINTATCAKERNGRVGQRYIS